MRGPGEAPRMRPMIANRVIYTDRIDAAAMAKRILIIYSSRYGNAEGVAEYLAGHLRKAGAAVDCVDLKKTGRSKWPQPAGYDVVVVGASVAMGRWTSQSKSFLERNAAAFQDGKTKLAVYVCSGTAANKPEEARKKYIEAPLAELGVKAHLALAVGPVYDFSDSSRMNFLMKRMMRAGAEDMGKDSGRKLDPDGRNDLRDWDGIRTFAGKVERA